MRNISIYRAINQFPHVAKVLKLFTPKGLIEQQKKHSTFIKASVERRINSEVERSDFMSYILPYSEEKVKMSMAEVRATYGALMIAGSENVATTLVFTIYHLLQNPDVLDQLIQEIRTSFKKPEEINFLALKSLKYLSAVVDESMRIHPAAPTSQPRVVPDGGCLISGHRVPGGVSLKS
jgi:cytochrome P450